MDASKEEAVRQQETVKGTVDSTQGYHIWYCLQILSHVTGFSFA